MTTQLQRDKRVEKAQMRVIFRVPFFAPAVARLPVVWDERVPTACTDGKVIRVGPKFWDSLTDQQCVTLLCHEVCHPLLGHLWRMPAGGNPRLWNEAADHKVNRMLKQFSADVIAKGEPDPFPFPEGSYCCDAAYDPLCEEEVYNRLSKRPPAGGGKPPGQPGGSGQEQGQPDPNARPVPFGEFESPDPSVAQTEEQKAVQGSWEETAVQCAQAAKSRGSLPGGVDREIDRLLNPQVPWYQLVRQWLREQADDDWSWLKPNPYFDESGFILPSLDSERMGAIVFATDTSGSIDQEVLRQFQSEKQNCLDELKPAKLLDIYCDSHIQAVREYVVGDEVSRKAPGGGGTAFQPVFEHVASLPAPPKCLVYLTDLMGSFPEKDPGYPVLWVTWESAGEVPFGEIVRVTS